MFLYEALFVYRGAFETKRLKEAQLAMMSAKLPVVQRLALTIRNDRSRLIRVLSEYLSREVSNEAEEMYTVCEVNDDDDTVIDISSKVVHVVIRANEQGEKEVRVHKQETDSHRGINFRNSKDTAYAFRILALLKYEKDNDSKCSYVATIAHTTRNKLVLWLTRLKEQVTGEVAPKKKRKRKEKTATTSKSKKTTVKKSKKKPEPVASDSDSSISSEDDDDDDNDDDDDDKKKQVATSKGGGGGGGGGGRGEGEGEGEHEGEGKDGEEAGWLVSIGERMTTSLLKTVPTPLKPELSQQQRRRRIPPVAIQQLPEATLRLQGAERVFYSGEEFLGPVPYVVPEAFTSLTFRQQPFAHLVLDRTCPAPHHVCCVIGRPDIYAAVIHALAHAEKLAEVRTLALLVPVDFHSVER
jgi:hypothetical protein